MHVRSFSNFETLRTACQTSEGGLFETLDWFDLLARHTLPAGAELQLLTAAAPGENSPPLLCLPLIREGQTMASLSNYYSGIFGPIVCRAFGNAPLAPALDAICHHLRAHPRRPAILRMQPLDTASDFHRDMQKALIAAGYRIDDYFCFGNWYLPSVGLSFAAYFADRPSALRNTVRRGRNRLDRAGPWQLKIHTQPGHELDAAIVAFETIYERSWKPPESHPGFIREMCRLAAGRGWLRLGALGLGDKTIASQIWLFDNGKACIFKLAYDPAAARYSPGSILTAAMMEHALDQDAATEIDYLSGDDTYKKDWMSHRRERYGLVAFDPATPRGLLAALRHFGGRALRRLTGSIPS